MALGLGFNVGDFIIRLVFWGYGFSIFITRNPQNGTGNYSGPPKP